jgi:hypothetical protein
MLAREWKAMIVVDVVGMAAMLCLGPWVAKLPPWLPQQVLDTFNRTDGYGSTGGPPPATSGINVMSLLLVITFGCIAAYFWWITRPLDVDCQHERDHSRPTPPRP